MLAKAEARYIKISAQKARLVIDLVRGQRAGDAIWSFCGPPISALRRRSKRF